MPDYFIFSIPGFTCLFWFIILACRWKKNSRSQNVLALNMGVMAITFYIWNIYFTGLDNYGYYYKLDAIDAFSTLLILPLTYFYFRSLTNEKPLNWKDYLWVLPALLIGGSTLILYGIMGEEKASAFVQELATNRGKLQNSTDATERLQYLISVRAYNFVIITQLICTSVYAFKALIGYRKRLQNFFSNLEGKSMDNNYAVLISFIISLILSLITFLIGKTRLTIDYPMAYLTICTIWGGILNYIGYKVASSQYTAEEFATDLAHADRKAAELGYGELPQKAKEDDVNDTESRKKNNSQLIEKFSQLIDQDKIYLKSDLRLDEVAKLINTNRTYISRLINEEFHCSFSDYINRERIRYAQHLMLTHKEMSHEQISELSGFVHVSSFCRTFKQQTETTFKDWKKKNCTF